MPSFKKGKRPLVYYWIIAIVAFLVIQQILQPIRAEGKPKEITYSQFVSMIDNGQVREVTKDDYNYTFTAVVDGDKQNSSQACGLILTLLKDFLRLAKNTKT